MQEQQKLPKKANKSALSHKNRQNIQQINDIEGLLVIDLLPIPEKIRGGNRIQTKPSREATSRKSHKSLAVNLQKHSKPPKIPKEKKKKGSTVETAKQSKVQTQKASEFQVPQQISKPTERHEQTSQYAKQSLEQDFIEKKMKVGRKAKSNAMKNFILETLMKGKAEGTCLVIHKGTAQCSYSPIAKNKSETKNHQKEEFPVILVQDGLKLSERRNKPNQSIFAGRTTKINRSSSTKNTAVNLPSINKKWVKMAKQYEKKHQKLQKVQQNGSIVEAIQQKIEACQEDNQNEHEQIQEQIIISNNQSLIKRQ